MLQELIKPDDLFNFNKYDTLQSMFTEVFVVCKEIIPVVGIELPDMFIYTEIKFQDTLCILNKTKILLCELNRNGILELIDSYETSYTKLYNEFQGKYPEILDLYKSIVKTKYTLGIEKCIEAYNITASLGQDNNWPGFNVKQELKELNPYIVGAATAVVHLEKTEITYLDVITVLRKLDYKTNQKDISDYLKLLHEKGDLKYSHITPDGYKVYLMDYDSEPDFDSVPDQVIYHSDVKNPPAKINEAVPTANSVEDFKKYVDEYVKRNLPEFQKDESVIELTNESPEPPILTSGEKINKNLTIKLDDYELPILENEQGKIPVPVNHLVYLIREICPEKYLRGLSDVTLESFIFRGKFNKYLGNFIPVKAQSNKIGPINKDSVKNILNQASTKKFITDQIIEQESDINTDPLNPEKWNLPHNIEYSNGYYMYTGCKFGVYVEKYVELKDFSNTKLFADYSDRLYFVLNLDKTKYMQLYSYYNIQRYNQSIDPRVLETYNLEEASILLIKAGNYGFVFKLNYPNERSVFKSFACALVGIKHDDKSTTSKIIKIKDYRTF